MKALILGSVLAFGSVTFSHGGDRPGPHGGFIEMPGAFHIEVVPQEEQSFKVYLLDMNFQNPSIVNSEVKAWLEVGKSKISLRCEVSRPDHFKCSSIEKAGQAKKLIVLAKREGAQGNEAKYTLPLKRP